MLGSEVLALVAELQAAFGKSLSQETKNVWIRELEPSDAQDGVTAVREIIRNEERFPSLATVLRYIGEADREKGLKALAADCRTMSRLRKEPYEQTVRDRLAMCEENFDLDDEYDQAWHEQAGMCQELLHRETGVVA